MKIKNKVVAITAVSLSLLLSACNTETANTNYAKETVITSTEAEEIKNQAVKFLGGTPTSELSYFNDDIVLEDTRFVEDEHHEVTYSYSRSAVYIEDGIHCCRLQLDSNKKVTSYIIYESIGGIQ